MPTTKARPCCARAQARVTMEEANLARVAKMAAKRASQGLSTARLEGRIDDAKHAIATAKQAVLDHEGDHADGRLK
jgi:hypothetical protein